MVWHLTLAVLFGGVCVVIASAVIANAMTAIANATAAIAQHIDQMRPGPSLGEVAQMYNDEFGQAESKIALPHE